MELVKRPFERRGDASRWLTSPAFDLKDSGSLEAEQAMARAKELLWQVNPKKGEINEVDELLRKSLGELDRFWVRWTEFRDSRAGKK